MKATKVRPAGVISNNAYNEEFEDAIVVPLTTNLDMRKHAVYLNQPMLEKGRLIKESRIKVDRILSVKQELIRKVIGKVKKEVLEEIIMGLQNILKS